MELIAVDGAAVVLVVVDEGIDRELLELVVVVEDLEDLIGAELKTRTERYFSVTKCRKLRNKLQQYVLQFSFQRKAIFCFNEILHQKYQIHLHQAAQKSKTKHKVAQK